jgi:hypothetical protein
MTSNTSPEASMATTDVVGSPTAADSAQVDIVRTFFKNWDYDTDFVHYQIIIEVKNNDTAAADIHAGDQSYVIYDKDGTVLKTGIFYYMFPQVLEPGALGYYTDSGMFESGMSASRIGEMTPSLSAVATSQPTTNWEISDLSVSREDFYGDAQVNGTVRNTSDTDATLGVIGVVLFGAGDEILGAIVDHTSARSLRAGESKTFESSKPGIPLSDPALVISTKAFGLEYPR